MQWSMSTSRMHFGVFQFRIWSSRRDGVDTHTQAHKRRDANFCRSTMDRRRSRIRQHLPRAWLNRALSRNARPRLLGCAVWFPLSGRVLRRCPTAKASGGLWRLPVARCMLARSKRRIDLWPREADYQDDDIVVLSREALKGKLLLITEDDEAIELYLERDSVNALMSALGAFLMEGEGDDIPSRITVGRK